MDEEKLSKYRAEVIIELVNIEKIMNAIISQHYFKKVVLPFYLEVLYDELFSFGLRRRIVEKIIVGIDKQIVDDLNRLNTIRNYFAHCDLELFASLDTDKKHGRVVDPRNIQKEIDFESLHSEFMQKKTGVLDYLVKVFKDLGGALVKR